MTKLPDQWKKSTLGDVAKWGSGGTPAAGNAKYYNGDIPWAIIGDLDDTVVSRTAKLITKLGLDNSSAKIVPVGAILIAMYGSIGKLGIAGIPMATNQAIAFAVPDETIVLKSYLFHYLRSQREIFLWNGKGATQQNISQTFLKSWEIPIPPIVEQYKIVELLEDHLSRLEAALVDVKQAKLMATQFRRSLLQAGLNGSFNDGPKDGIFGFPKTWRLKTLSEVADWTSGGTPSSKDSELYGGEIPWIVIGDLTEGIVLETEKKITQKGLDSSSAKKLPVGTVMVAMYGASIGRTGVMGREMTTNQAIACGIPKSEEILGKYLLYFLQSQKNEFIAAGRGGAQPNISQGVVKSWRIPLPPLDEQLAIINEIDGQLEHLLQANRVTESLLKESTAFRHSLLQAAFTGQLTKEVVDV
jgi:type I restriction enzyme S subunit